MNRIVVFLFDHFKMGFLPRYQRFLPRYVKQTCFSGWIEEIGKPLREAWMARNISSAILYPQCTLLLCLWRKFYCFRSTLKLGLIKQLLTESDRNGGVYANQIAIEMSVPKYEQCFRSFRRENCFWCDCWFTNEADVCIRNSGDVNDIG